MKRFHIHIAVEDIDRSIDFYTTLFADKQWVADPQGVAWETFLTHGEATVYGNTGATERLAKAAAQAPACGCGPKT